MEQNKDQSGAAVRGEAVETQPGSPNFDGAAAYEAFLDAGGYGVQLVPKWAGQFDTHQQWTNKAASWLKSPDWNRPICVDSLGRRMAIGMDMAKARDEGTFPVRYFWECELAPASARAADALSEPSEREKLLEEFYCASTAWENACGHPDATADDERKAEERFIAAGKAMCTMPVKYRTSDAFDSRPTEPYPLLRAAFTTAESGANGYFVKFRFPTIQAMQDAHSQWIGASSHPTDGGVRNG